MRRSQACAIGSTVDTTIRRIEVMLPRAWTRFQAPPIAQPGVLALEFRCRPSHLSLVLGKDTKQPLAQATKSRGWEGFSVTTTEAHSRTIPDQSLGKSPYAEIDGSGIRPYDATPNVTHLVSASFMSQTSTCTFGTWGQKNFSNVNTPSEAATDDTPAAPSTTSSPMPSLASTAHLATTQCIWVLVCLGATVLFYI